MATDPVCLAIVEEENARFTASYRDQKYYFCCNYCRKQFEENPRRYTRIAANVTVNLGECD
ncbi:YHS domain-containing protein [Methanoregula sp.]|uniref:YHS domain-containing protein n=1 Tax=Methanoregula sp. TaxID=2052170 RepID=UPI000CB43E31|nr:YHS domain-containing protein [Methanoregula sp.]PKG32092.1 MAG: YHS domain-containing protein [Methanoregula sp.]